MGYGFYYFFDPTYILIIIGAIICVIASAHVRTTYSKFQNVASATGMTGAEAAKRLLRANGITDVTVTHVAGNLTDHYDPRNKTLSLSDSVYNSTSVAAIGVAAHETGHAVQHNVGYVPLSLRSAIVPIANFGSMMCWPLIIIGFCIRSEMGTVFINVGIIVFLAVVLFQLITLPVEFNASRRGLDMIEREGILNSEELRGTKKVLGAAAMTYVASAAAAILQLLRLLILAGNRNRD